MKPVIRNTDTAIIAPARRTREQGPITAQQAQNARRIARYWQRRQGVEEPRLILWRP